VIARLKLWAALVGAAVIALAASYFGGRKAANADAKIKRLQDYAKTRQKMDEADAVVGDDPAAARMFLEQRGKRSGDL
jgi:hypothetical protein